MKIKKQKMLADFRDMIRLETVSNLDASKVNQKAFRDFRKLLQERFPYLKKAAKRKEIGQGVLYHIKGEQSDAPTVLMAHYDVVPANAEEWAYPPFAATYAEGRIYGRGTLDTKSTLCAIVTAVDSALSEGWRPKQDLYLSFGGEEETCGETCELIVDYLAEMGVRPALVLDEGGAVVEDQLPGIAGRAAMIGIAEKGIANYMLVLSGEAGHASTPPRHTTAGRLARVACRIEDHPFPARLTPAVKTMFKALAKEAPLYAKFAFANPGLLSPALANLATRLGKTTNAMVRTTAAVVIIDCRSAFNVLPDKAALGVNVRLLAGDTIAGVAEQLKKIAGDPDIEVLPIAGAEPSPVSRTDGPAWQTLTATVKEMWPDAIVAPYQMNGGTDARNFARISDCVYRFSPMEMDQAEERSVHGKNESIAVEKLFKTAVFYAKLLEKI